MIKLLLLVLSLSSLPIGNTIDLHQEKTVRYSLRAIESINRTLINNEPLYPYSLSEIKELLYKEKDTLRGIVIEKVLISLSCAYQYQVDHNNIVTIIDYSLPANQKRLWIFDLSAKKLLFHTYVSHGITSGALFTNYFSNKFNSKASSIGVYKTGASYYGREGLSLRLTGLDVSFNDNASNRSIVMHGGWYLEERFIKKYGRPGRSWGCPAVPVELAKGIINTIKDDSLFIVYYPSDRWLNKSRFLHCAGIKKTALEKPVGDSQLPIINNVIREDILYADLRNHHQWNDSTPVLVMKAENYEQLFNSTAPVGRMLRRQINRVEYIALSNAELNRLVHEINLNNKKESYNTIFFVVPEIIMKRGYYETQMKLVDLGKVKEIRAEGDYTERLGARSYIVFFEEKPELVVRPTSQFIRWVGL